MSQLLRCLSYFPLCWTKLMKKTHRCQDCCEHSSAHLCCNMCWSVLFSIRFYCQLRTSIIFPRMKKNFECTFVFLQRQNNWPLNNGQPSLHGHLHRALCTNLFCQSIDSRCLRHACCYKIKLFVWRAEMPAACNDHVLQTDQTDM